MTKRPENGNSLNASTTLPISVLSSQAPPIRHGTKTMSDSVSAAHLATVSGQFSAAVIANSPLSTHAFVANREANVRYNATSASCARCEAASADASMTSLPRSVSSTSRSGIRVSGVRFFESESESGTRRATEPDLDMSGVAVFEAACCVETTSVSCVLGVLFTVSEVVGSSESASCGDRAAFGAVELPGTDEADVSKCVKTMTAPNDSSWSSTTVNRFLTARARPRLSSSEVEGPFRVAAAVAWLDGR